MVGVLMNSCSFALMDSVGRNLAKQGPLRRRLRLLVFRGKEASMR